jgi:hypothetical protein
VDDSTRPLPIARRFWLSYGLCRALDRACWARLLKFLAHLSDTLWVWMLLIPAAVVFLSVTIPPLLESPFCLLIVGLGLVGIVGLSVFNFIYKDVKRR